MSIIISEKGMNARKLEPTSIAQEDYLQAYIKNNPHAIPIDEIKEDLRLLVLAREFPTRSGPIDALGVDQDGNIYVIETKLAKNPDKRYVLAQVLDYGAALWRTYENGDEFVERLERSVAETFHSTLGDKIGDFFSKEFEDVTALIQTARQNLSAGDFRFVVLMDRLEDRLKNLITFVNRNSQFTIYGVEMEFYKFDRFEILIPKLFGAEVTKEVSAPKATGAKQQWDEASFFAKAEQELSAIEVASLRKLYEFSLPSLKWNTNQTGTFSVKFSHIDPKKAFYTVYSTGVLELNLSWHEEGNAAVVANILREELKKLPDLDNGKNFKMQHVSVQAKDWSPQVDKIVEVIRNVTQMKV
ncbi:MAG: hypothetical protein DMF67_11525 [Acidobacteria bacterium]|nr:MAG: hypothetical protein DMF66_12475 [Acidobacteriota bacterium]PYS82808.1 MAG: hypothetical protein DMF67_11525 [Acidobacteriota bacterium]